MLGRPFSGSCGCCFSFVRLLGERIEGRTLRRHGRIDFLLGSNHGLLRSTQPLLARYVKRDG